MPQTSNFYCYVMVRFAIADKHLNTIICVGREADLHGMSEKCMHIRFPETFLHA